MKNEKLLIVENVIENLSQTFSKDDTAAVLSQIEGHKYFLDVKLSMDVTFAQAAFSWMENVYLPINEEMNSFLTIVSFSKKNRSNLFFELCDHQLMLSLDEGKSVLTKDVVSHYCVNYGSPVGKFLSRLSYQAA